MQKFKQMRLTIRRLFDRLVIWFWSKTHPCRLGWKEYDHDWKYQSDWYGDPGVIGGTADCSYWECEACGEIDTESPPPDYDDYYDPAEWR